MRGHTDVYKYLSYYSEKAGIQSSPEFEGFPFVMSFKWEGRLIKVEGVLIPQGFWILSGYRTEEGEELVEAGMLYPSEYTLMSDLWRPQRPDTAVGDWRPPRRNGPSYCRFFKNKGKIASLDSLYRRFSPASFTSYSRRKMRPTFIGLPNDDNSRNPIPNTELPIPANFEEVFANNNLFDFDN